MPLFVPSSIFVTLIFFEVICGWMFLLETVLCLNLKL